MIEELGRSVRIFWLVREWLPDLSTFPLSGYWRGLASSANFPGKTLEACLHVLHVDIVRIWNIQDDFVVIMHTSSPLLAVLTKCFL